MKVLFITNTPPTPTWGGAMTFYRHFCERNDFIISVITSDEKIKDYYDVPYPFIVINRGRLWTKISRTRFYRWAHTWSLLVGCLFIPKNVLDHARKFKPDAIFTVAGSWSWTAILARKVAKKLNIPLIGSYNDWWSYNTIYLPNAARMIERKFRNFYSSCDLVFCTSEGMKNALGVHRNSVILYPTGSFIKNPRTIPAKEQKDVFTVAFAGNLGDWYGKMLETLVTEAAESGIRFKFFGSNPSWSKGFEAYLKEENIYLGQISFTRLQKEIQSVDALLLLMGFDESSAIIETTSFKTKFLDYIAFQKPIILWGPSYCSAVKIAQEFDSAEICISAKPEDFVRTIMKVKSDILIRERLVSNSNKMYQERFNPDKIHSILKTSIQALKRS
jgi:glycosyltransferase involved in cell wall biosynthesis